MRENKNCSLLWCYRILRWLVGGTFIFTSISKLRDHRQFAETIAEFGIVVEGIEITAAVIIIVCEFVLGMGLLLDIKGTLSAIFLLLLTFFTVLGYGIYLGLDIDCGCFGDDVFKFTSGLQDALWKDIVFLIIVSVIFYLRNNLKISPKSMLGNFAWRGNAKNSR